MASVPKNSKKPMCVHFHIFKNAGSTLDFILEKNFSKDAIRMESGTTGGRLDFKQAMRFLKTNHPHVKSLSSHQIRFPLPETNYYHFLPIIFIRHPIDRAISVYFFNKKRRDGRNDLNVQKAKTHSLKDFLDWLILKKKNNMLKNQQVFFLSGKPSGSPVSLEDLQNSKTILNNCPITGIVDRMDESLILGEEVLRPYFSNIDLSYFNQNISKKRRGNLEEKLEKEKIEIGTDTYQKLLGVNELDLNLYKFANEILDQRLKKIKNIKEKLLEFKTRCDEESMLFNKFSTNLKRKMRVVTGGYVIKLK